MQEGAGFSNNQEYAWSRGAVPINSNFTTFADWTDPRYLRLKFETSEAAGTFIFKGTLNGVRIYSFINSVWSEGCPLDYTGTTTVTTTQLFDAIPYQIVKPITKGRVSLYTVDLLGAEQLVAIYDPTETNPAWKRYKVPECSKWTSTVPGYYVTICKLAFNAVTNDNDELVLGNIGAYKKGLQALLKEDNEDYQRANQLWADAKKILADEVGDDTGYGADDVVQLSDDFHVTPISWGL
jgi:hypothetical protein